MCGYIVIAGTILTLLGAYVGHGIGVKSGADAYHRTCLSLEPGRGFIVDEEDGTVVQCSSLGTIPKEELRKYHDKQSGT